MIGKCYIVEFLLDFQKVYLDVINCIKVFLVVYMIILIYLLFKVCGNLIKIKKFNNLRFFYFKVICFFRVFVYLIYQVILSNFFFLFDDWMLCDFFLCLVIVDNKILIENFGEYMFQVCFEI